MILIVSPSDFIALNERLNMQFGYPDSKGTQRYAEPIINPTNVNEVAIVIEDRCLPYLTESESAAIISEAAITSWFRGPQ